MIVTMLMPTISSAMLIVYKPTIQEIMKNDLTLQEIIEEFEKKFKSTKGDPELINSLLRTETDGKNVDGLTKEGRLVHKEDHRR